MAAEDKSKVDKTQKNRRRRKKRRTEDFSSDSDSSSEEETTEKGEIEEEIKVQEAEPVNMDIDIDITPLQENDELTPQNLTTSTKLKLQRIQITDLSKEETGNDNKIDLTQQYLKLFANEFNEDIEELRKKPDFTDKSLVILAKALQSGSNIFDPSTLQALIEK